MSDSGPIHQIFIDDQLVYVLSSLTIEDFHGQTCYVGVGAEHSAKGDDWRSGLKVFVPISAVKSIIEFPNLDSYHERIKSYYRKKAEG